MVTWPWVTGPKMRIARPGPGKGCRWTREAGIESRRPNARTSSIQTSDKCELRWTEEEWTFEQLPQRLYQLQLHILQQPSNVMMCLYRRTWPFKTDTFNHVGV